MIERGWKIAAAAALLGGVVLIVGAGYGGVGRVAVGAGQATPGVERPAFPQPNECVVEPRSLPLFESPAPNAPAATPVPLASPTPFAVPAGEAADEATTAAVVATIREAIACRNAGDFARAYALFSDRMLRQLFGGPATVDPEIGLALAERPQRVPREQRLALVGVSTVRLLADGRAGAVVVTATAREAFADYLYLVQVDDRWLIDETVALPIAAEATPTP